MSHVLLLLRALLLLCGWPLLLFVPIRFAWQPADCAVAVLLAIAMPWSAVVVLLGARQKWSDVAGGVLAVSLLFYTALVGLFVLVFCGPYKDGRDLGFEQFAEVRWNGTAVRLYRTNGGATTAFGVKARHERDLIPGVRLVRSVDSWYRCYELTATASDRGVELRDSRNACETFGPGNRTYTLRKFIYF